MDWQTLLGWSGPALDVAGLVALGVVLWQLRQDPTAAWQEYESRLRELQESLRLLVLQAEGEARELDGKLAARADELRALHDGPTAATGGGPAASARSVERAVRARAQSFGGAATEAGSPPSGSDTTGSAGANVPATAAASLAERVQQLAAARTPVAEIARRLSLSVAEARVLAGLTTGGLAYAAAAARPAATASEPAPSPARAAS